jgi:hypothetical protein
MSCGTETLRIGVSKVIVRINPRIIQRERLLKNWFQFFLARHGETAGAVELGEAGQVRDEGSGGDDTITLGFHLIASWVNRMRCRATAGSDR